ncbi:unnamed protein product [Brachionus calyciflorus]|uniref:SSUH2 n=1 Tax=Brachionus calyciflorus TaxID=104777 RepID=A0A813WW72_9BILA|nr:unnamed protein product [Brachionus calyciflorus]
MENPNFYPDINNNNDDAPPSYPDNPIQFDGYQNLGFCAPEPGNNQPFLQEKNNVLPIFNDNQILTEEDAEDALVAFVGEHCCYGKGPVKNLEITDLKPSNTYRYILESFTETRSTKYVSEPYFQQIIVNTGAPPPHPWSIPVTPNQLFIDQKVLLEIPNTAQVEICKKCSGRGNRTCYSCSGRGRKSCIHCHGSGHKHNSNHHHRENCFFCSGTGFSNCHTCGHTGFILCKICSGSGRLKWYLQLTVEFKNNKDDFFSKTEFIPDELLRNCLTKNTFSDTNLRLFPITNHPNKYINEASSSLLGQHYTKFNQCKILSQRHEVDSIPINLVTYNYKNKILNYIIYGLESRVYAPDYPQKCCCNIL